MDLCDGVLAVAGDPPKAPILQVKRRVVRTAMNDLDDGGRWKWPEQPKNTHPVCGRYGCLSVSSAVCGGGEGNTHPAIVRK